MKTKEINTKNITAIKLPSSFKDSRIFISEDKDTIIIKKIQSLTSSEIRQRLKSVGGMITEAEIDQEVQNYRRGK